MHILFLMPYPPWPLTFGDRMRTNLFLNRLAERNNVKLTIISFYEQDNKLKFEDSIRGKNINLICINREKFILRAMYALRYYFRYPLRVSNYCSARFRDQIVKILSEQKIDVIIVSSVLIAVNLLELKTGVPIVVDSIDSKSLYIKRRLDLSKSFYKKLLQYEYKQLIKYEKLISKKSNNFIVCSDVDKKHLEEQCKITEVNVVRNPEFFDNQLKRKIVFPKKVVKRVLFSGNMNYFPNRDAVKHFINEVLPLLELRNKDIKFQFCGVGKIKDKYCRDNVEFLGKVEDMQSTLKSADIYISPLRTGSGVKYKIIEAMVAGIPIVCYQLSNDGINAIHLKEILIAKSHKEFAEYIELLVDNYTLREKISNNARKFIEKYLEEDPAICLFEIFKSAYEDK